MSRQIVMNLDGKPHIYQEAVRFNTEIWIDKKDGTIEKMCCRDLGPVNEDGCLPSPWGGYPKIIHEVNQTRIENGEDVHYDNLWCVEIHEPVLVCTDEYLTEQEAKDAWNQRN